MGVTGERYCKISIPSPLLEELCSPVQGNKRRPSQSAGTWEAENRWGWGQSEVVFAGSPNYRGTWIHLMNT
uniref:Uncharacterized protein n=1 Tax=Pseudonaja textilis TaxID=8673 RepID=A0A670XTE4_PSETE